MKFSLSIIAIFLISGFPLNRIHSGRSGSPDLFVEQVLATDSAFSGNRALLSTREPLKERIARLIASARRKKASAKPGTEHRQKAERRLVELLEWGEAFSSSDDALMVLRAKVPPLTDRQTILLEEVHRSIKGLQPGRLFFVNASDTLAEIFDFSGYGGQVIPLLRPTGEDWIAFINPLESKVSMAEGLLTLLHEAFHVRYPEILKRPTTDFGRAFEEGVTEYLTRMHFRRRVRHGRKPVRKAIREEIRQNQEEMQSKSAKDPIEWYLELASLQTYHREGKLAEKLVARLGQDEVFFAYKKGDLENIFEKVPALKRAAQIFQVSEDQFFGVINTLLTKGDRHTDSYWQAMHQITEFLAHSGVNTFKDIIAEELLRQRVSKTFWWTINEIWYSLRDQMPVEEWVNRWDYEAERFARVQGTIKRWVRRQARHKIWVEKMAAARIAA